VYRERLGGGRRPRTATQMAGRPGRKPQQEWAGPIWAVFPDFFLVPGFVFWGVRLTRLLLAALYLPTSSTNKNTGGVAWGFFFAGTEKKLGIAPSGGEGG